MNKVLGKFYDNRRSDSVSTNIRKNRLAFFKSLLASVPGPLRILDIGGRQRLWETTTDFLAEEMRDIEITLINLNPRIVKEVNHPKIKGIVGDARHLPQFKNNEFDVVFSNSVIEHVGDYNDQLQMANELMRVGKRYFVQTPNLYFPIEPHFVFPLFQFLPVEVRVSLITHFDLGWIKKITDKQRAKQAVTSIRLVSKKEVMALFPNANLYEEKLFGLTKSFIVYGGWDTTPTY
jgi:2-polyprenyl-3-methyl-5-hydroxy-6-metoxy-1,4-benzoquinol methylase